LKGRERRAMKREESASMSTEPRKILAGKGAERGTDQRVKRRNKGPETDWENQKVRHGNGERAWQKRARDGDEHDR
jgi:hypothetical protein